MSVIRRDADLGIECTFKVRARYCKNCTESRMEKVIYEERTEFSARWLM